MRCWPAQGLIHWVAVTRGIAPALLGVCVLTTLATPLRADPPSRNGCPQSGIEFCKQKLGPATTSVTCYERHGLAPEVAALDLTPLTCLPALTEVTLASGEIEFIERLKLGALTPLARLPQLTRLALEETALVEISALAALKRLQKLSLHSSQVKDLRPLAGLGELRELDLSCTAVSELAPLQSLTRLEKLDLTKAPVRSLEALAGLLQLKWLGLSADAAIPAEQREALKKRLPGLTIGVGRAY